MGRCLSCLHRSGFEEPSQRCGFLLFSCLMSALITQNHAHPPPFKDSWTQVSLLHIMTLLNTEYGKGEWMLDFHFRALLCSLATPECRTLSPPLPSTSPCPLWQLPAYLPYSVRNEKTDWSISVGPVKEGTDQPVRHISPVSILWLEFLCLRRLWASRMVFC